MTSGMPLARQVLQGLLLLGVCLPAWGQDSSQTTSDGIPPADTQPADAAATQPAWAGPLERAMLTWQDGEQEQAVQQVLSIRWDNLKFHPDSIFSQKEKDLPSLSPTRLQLLVEEGLEASQIIRQLCRHMVKLADDSIQQARYPEAQRQLVAVQNCGLAIAGPDALTIMRLTGISIQRLALQKLVTLFGLTNQKDKQATAQQALDDLSRQQAEIVRESQRALEVHSRKPWATGSQPAR